MGAARDDLDTLLDYLKRGYVLVSGSGIDAAKYDLLEHDGWDVVAVYPAALESSKVKKQKDKEWSARIKKAHHPIEKAQN